MSTQQVQLKPSGSHSVISFFFFFFHSFIIMLFSKIGVSSLNHEDECNPSALQLFAVIWKCL